MLKFSGGKPSFFQESIGGTGESSPLVAGMATAAQQGQNKTRTHRLPGLTTFDDQNPA